MRTSLADATLRASLVGDPWTGEAVMAGLDVSVGALVGPDEHPTVANMAAKMSTPRNRDLFKGVQFIGFSTLESGMV